MVVQRRIRTPLEESIFEALNNKDSEKLLSIIKENNNVNLDCVDADGLTPLQICCHRGDFKLASILLDEGAKVDYSFRHDGYTPLMFASIGGRAELVKLLLQHGADTKIQNCVRRTASDMAGFVGQEHVSAMISCWIPFKDSIEPYTITRELEDKPRLSSKQLGLLLHEFVVYPSLHPVRLISFLTNAIDLVREAEPVCYVLENLSSKSFKPPINDDALSMKYHYLFYLVDYCNKAIKAKSSKAPEELSDDPEYCKKVLESIIRRLIKREKDEKPLKLGSALDKFITDCLMKFPYTQTSVFKAMTFAFSKCQSINAERSPSLAILVQSISNWGPRQTGVKIESCAVCEDGYNLKKCSKCKAILYCSLQCQRLDWFQHKRVCVS